MKPRTLALAGVAVAAVVTLAVVVPWRSSEAIGPDVDNDGVVDLFNDIYGVAAAFGQTFPTPTPITMSTYKLTSSCPGPSGAPCEVYCDPGDFATGGGYNAGGNSNVSTFPLVNAVG
ncbi:MAG: hypothetical protein Q8R78_02390, partial [Candidatus Omnitrophota bacterium]|nr:hypothetical protein [Candidatus Omnitrophota bacterium]